MATIYDLDTLKRQVDILRDALTQYANPDNWLYYRGGVYIIETDMAEDDEADQVIFSPEFTMNMPGYQLAQTALENADKIISKDLWSENT